MIYYNLVDNEYTICMINLSVVYGQMSLWGNNKLPQMYNYKKKSWDSRDKVTINTPSCNQIPLHSAAINLHNV